MDPTFKIADNSWTGLSEPRLDAFSTIAAEIVSDPALYPELSAEAVALTSASAKYHLALSRYLQFTGSENREAKDFAKSLLFKAHTNVARKLEATADGNVEYLTRPGYRLDRKGGGHSLATVWPPSLKKVESKTVRGRVKFILGARNPREIKAILGRSSQDNGVTWTEGIIAYDLNFTLDGLPSGVGMLFQFRFRATNNRMSDWSEKIYVEVY